MFVGCNVAKVVKTGERITVLLKNEGCSF